MRRSIMKSDFYRSVLHFILALALFIDLTQVKVRAEADLRRFPSARQVRSAVS
jgi:hypothetical protein